MNSRTLATILAALRNLQIDLRQGHLDLAQDFSEIFSDHAPMTSEEIDTLCQSLNFSESEMLHWQATSRSLPDEDIMCLIHCTEGTTGEAYMDSGEWHWSGMAGIVKTPVTHWTELPLGPHLPSQPVTPQPEKSEATTPESEARRLAIIDLADEQHPNEDISVDADAILSEGDDNGCYISAWLWISFSGTPYDKETEKEA